MLHSSPSSSAVLWKLPALTMPVAVTLAMIGFIGLYVYAAHEDLEKILIFVALVTAGFGQIAVSFYTARTLNAMVERDNRDYERQLAADVMQQKRDELFHEQKEYELKKAAMAYGSRWNDPSMTAARDTLRQIMSHDDGRVSGAVSAFIDQNEAAVQHVVNFFEEMATALRLKLAHEDLLRDQFDFVVVKLWTVLTNCSYVRNVREKERNHAIWEDVERQLYDRWKIH